MKLAKLEYFADFIHFAFHNQPISGESAIYTRQNQGALSRALTDELEALKRDGLIEEDPKYHYKAVKKVDVGMSDEEKKTISYVIERYGK